MHLRPERPEDFPAIYELIRTAFATAAVSTGDEQNFVNRLRASAAYLPELALVAVDGGRPVGHIMLTKISLQTPKGPFELLLLAPLAVALDYRRQGLGARLVREACQRAQDRGYPAVVVVGDPAYYHRFGFITSTACGIRASEPIPAANVMVLELVPGALQGLEGTIAFQV